MTSNLENYLEALSVTKKHLDPPEGFSTYNTTLRQTKS